MSSDEATEIGFRVLECIDEVDDCREVQSISTLRLATTPDLVGDEPWSSGWIDRATISPISTALPHKIIGIGSFADAGDCSILFLVSKVSLRAVLSTIE